MRAMKKLRDDGYLRVSIQMTEDDQLSLFQDPDAISFLGAPPEDVRNRAILRSSLFDENGCFTSKYDENNTVQTILDKLAEAVCSYRKRNQ